MASENIKGWHLDLITFKKDYRCFKEGDKIPFKPGINLLVGDQGVGKSTLLHLISSYQRYKDIIDLSWCGDGGGNMFSVDMEMDLPRGRSFNDRLDMRTSLAVVWSSHGQVVNKVLDKLSKESHKDCLFLIDEPDMALSPRSCYRLVDRLKECEKNGNQILASVHNPIVMKAIDEMYSIEHRRSMSADEFLEIHRTKNDTF